MGLDWLSRTSKHIPLPVYQALYRRRTISICYHLVSDMYVPHVRHLYPYKSESMFENDLVYLKRHYHPISYEEYREHIIGGKSLPTNALLLTFDDGFSECYTVVLPLLKKFAFPCIFFISTDTLDNQFMLYRHKVSLCIERITGAGKTWRQSAFDVLNKSLNRNIESSHAFIDWVKSLNILDTNTVNQVCQILEVDVSGYLKYRQPYLSTEEIKIMDSDGFTIGAHTKTHPLLRLLSEAEMEDEIVASCRQIGEITRKEQVPFAFPFLGHGVSREFLQQLRARYSEIDLIFDAMGIRRDMDFIVQRIEADQPIEKAGGKLNLPWVLHKAYQDSFISGGF